MELLLQEKKDVKKCKKKLNILEIAATDKENLTSKIHKKKMNISNTKSAFAKKNKKCTDLDNKIVTQVKNNINVQVASHPSKNQSTHSVKIAGTDLTVDNPSESYWQNLAESCREALNTALKENVDLHNKVNELEYENSRLKEMLNEAKSLVEVLTEMIQEKSDEPNEPSDTLKEEEEEEESCENETFEETQGVISESDIEDMSFQSCI